MSSRPTDAAAPRLARPGIGRRLAELVYRLRTEADTPVLQSLSVAAGVIVGCLPVYGLHLPLCLACGRLLRLNRVTMYLAANLNNPLLGPFLVYLQIQAGAVVRRGALYPLSTAALRDVRLVACLGDLVVGSLVVGLLLGAVAGLVAYGLLRESAGDRFRQLLVERAALPYLRSGYQNWEFVRSKLRHDKVYLDLLARGLLPARGRLLDLGCGRGLLLALVAADRSGALDAPRPEDWPPPSAGLELIGVEGRGRTAAVARRALAGEARICRGDLRRVELPTCSAAVLLDVLHYLDHDEQVRLLDRVRAVLEPGGVLVVREAAAGWSWRFAVTAAVERLRAVLRGHPGQRFCYRSTATWRERLESLGLELEVEPARRGTVFGNVLLVARCPTETPVAPGRGGVLSP